MLFGGQRDIQHVATGGLDEQRLLGTKVIGDLARKGVGGCGDISDRNRRQPSRLEQAARRIEQTRAHLPARNARGSHAVLGIARRVFCGAAFHASLLLRKTRGNRLFALFVWHTNKFVKPPKIRNLLLEAPFQLAMRRCC